MDIKSKYNALRAQVSAYERVLVAYSGGIDSTLVLKVACDVLGDRALGITADSPSIPRHELREAQRIAQNIGANHRIIHTREFDNKNYTSNPINRCYYCKTALYDDLVKIAKTEGFSHIANGTNLDDIGDFRPGLEAATESSVVSPLRDASLTKDDTRAIARMLRLEIWDKPASPCLSSRIPYGESVTKEKLAMIEAAEDFLRGLSIRELRVRHFGPKARIETNRADFPVLRAAHETIRRRLSEIGFRQVEFSEFKSGSLNNPVNK